MNNEIIELNKNIANLPNETWKDIINYEGFYQVSDMGRVKSLDRISCQNISLKGIILNSYLNNDGFYYVCLLKNGKQKKFLVLQLVGRHFIENIAGRRNFKHKDKNRKNNRVENIEFHNYDKRFDEGFRTCCKCEREFSLSEFYLLQTGKYTTDCKECNRKESNEYVEKHLEEVRRKSREYHHKNKEKRNISRKKYYALNKNKILKQDQARKKERAKTDINYKTRVQYKNLLSTGLRKQMVSKNNRRSSDFVGCSWEFLKNYIELQFESWMTWGNYGKNGWHLGHILPCELFELKNENEAKICFNFTNIKPQCGIENITNQDFLENGKRARDLNRQEKLEYLSSKGIDVTNWIN